MASIYLDNAASTKVSEACLNRFNQVAKSLYGNPSSKHNEGLMANECIQDVKESIASRLNCKDDDVYFTMGATMSNQLCIQGFLAKHPDWNLVECSSTSEAACLVANKNSSDCAAIASELAADVSKLEVIKTGIEDDPRNYTRFIVIKANNTQGEISSNVDDSATGLKLASVAFVTKNEPGALMTCLEKFHQSSMNLTRLESRPIQGQPWRYMFYVDIAMKDSGSENSEISDEALYKVIENLKQQTEDVRLLGIYSEVN